LISCASAFGLHLVMMHWPVGASLIAAGPLPAGLWGLELLLSLSLLLAVEAQKWLFRRTAAQP
jgi:hypothetical protein